jgi:two-component system sensor histidine kinase MprB
VTLRRPLIHVSLRARLSLLVAVAVGVAFAIATLAVYVTVSHELRSQLDENLIRRAQAAVNSPLGDPRALSAVPSLALGAADLRVALLGADGSAVLPEGVTMRPPLDAPELSVAAGNTTMSLRTATVGGEQYRVVAVPDRPGVALVLARSTEDTEQTLSRLGVVLLVVGIAGMGAAAAIGWAIGRAGLRPIERLTSAAEHVAATDELTSIEVVGDDELARLTVSFNTMLEALAQSRNRQRQLVADAGHELRTPLTSLRTNLDLLAQSDRAPNGGLDPRERSELLADVRAQLEELSAAVADLVELARDDAPAASAEPVDLAAVTESAVARVRRRASDLTFDVELQPWVVDGDVTALERAVTNLLDNAAKWSPPDGTVQVRLTRGELTVCDEGPGISEEDLPHVFERFYRASDARKLPGSGLGLAIVRQAAERHGGTVTAGRSSAGGAMFVLKLPGQPFGVPEDSWPALR